MQFQILKKVQSFLGFVNIYRHFMDKFPKIYALLTASFKKNRVSGDLMLDILYLIILN